MKYGIRVKSSRNGLVCINSGSMNASLRTLTAILALASLGLLAPLHAITYEQWAVTEFGSADSIDAAPGADPDEDTIVNLRNQLDSVKDINLDMYTKLAVG